MCENETMNCILFMCEIEIMLYTLFFKMKYLFGIFIV